VMSPTALPIKAKGRGHTAAPAEQRDYIASPLHSITSSARASSVGGMSRPSAWAVLRLIASLGACGHFFRRPADTLGNQIDRTRPSLVPIALGHPQIDRKVGAACKRHDVIEREPTAPVGSRKTID